MIQFLQTYRRVVAALSIPVLLALTSCATVDPQPFSNFQRAAQTLRDSSASALKAVEKEAKTEDLVRVAENPLQFSGLRLQFLEPAFNWTYPQGEKALLFTSLASRNQVATKLNAAFADYAGLLVNLTSAGQMTQAQLDQQVADINANAQTVLDALGAKVPAGSIELFSHAGVDLAAGLVDRARRRALEKMLAANQGAVDKFAALGAQLMVDNSNDINTQYDDDFVELQRGFVPASVDGRGPVLDQVLSLNQATGSAMDLSAQLYASYRQLPAAHRQLLDSLNNQRPSLTDIDDFLGRATQLAKLAEQVVAEKKKPANSPAN